MAVLLTALRKTVIAGLVTAQLLHRHLCSRIIFMVPTKTANHSLEISSGGPSIALK
jgi:ERCC4-related helicase